MYVCTKGDLSIVYLPWFHWLKQEQLSFFNTYYLISRFAAWMQHVKLFSVCSIHIREPTEMKSVTSAKTQKNWGGKRKLWSLICFPVMSLIGLGPNILCASLVPSSPPFPLLPPASSWQWWWQWQSLPLHRPTYFIWHCFSSGSDTKASLWSRKVRGRQVGGKWWGWLGSMSAGCCCQHQVWSP